MKMPKPTSITANALEFIRSIRPSTGLVYWSIVILFLLGGLSIISRFNQAVNERQLIWLRKHQSALNGLETEIGSAIHVVEGMQTVAGAYYINPATTPSPFYEMLVPRPDLGGYALEHIKLPYTINEVANLTGSGNLEQGDVSLHREIEMTLSLTPVFRWVKRTYPFATWIYYTSARNFISMYPWVSADDFFFTLNLYKHEFFTGGLPQNNPNRRSFITEVYRDEAGQGLMVTIAAPVYENDTFRGTVAIDFTLTTLNQFFPEPQYGGEKAFVVNKQDQVVALSTAKTMDTILGIADAFPDLGTDEKATLLALPSGRVHPMDWYYVLVQPVKETPWTYIAIVRQQHILIEAGIETAPIMFLILLFIAAMVLAEQRARQENRLRTSEAKFKTIYEGSNDAIMLLSEEGFFDCNPRTLEMFGFENKEEFLRIQPATISPPTQPDGRDSWLAGNERIRAALQQGFDHFEWTHRRKDGTDFPAEILFSAFEYNGTQVLQATVRDITERKRAETAEHEQRVLAEALRDVSAVLNSSLSLDQMLDNILTHVGNVVPHDTISIMLINEEGLAYVVREHGSIEPGARERLFASRLPVASTGNLQKMMDTGQPYIVPDTQLEPGWIHNRGMDDAQQALSYAGIPILLKGQVAGFINLGSHQAGFFTWEHTERLRAFANQIAIAFTNARLVEDLRRANIHLQASLEEVQSLQAELFEQAIRDSLTGLFNRRYLEETLAREISRARRSGQPVGIIILDIDHFKKVNDTYGHSAGDVVLKVLGDMLTANSRDEDIACRFGGEEFVIVMPGVSLLTAFEKAERLRIKFENRQIPYENQILRAMISLGVAIFPEHGATGEEVLRHADQALYQAKQAGRNRTVVYSGSSTA